MRRLFALISVISYLSFGGLFLGAIFQSNPIYATDIAPATETDANGNPIVSSAFCTNTTDTTCHGEQGFFDKIYTKVYDIIIIVAGFLAVGLLAFNGLKLITAGGDPSKIKTARANVITILIGSVIITAAYFIIRFAESLGGAVSKL